MLKSNANITLASNPSMNDEEEIFYRFIENKSLLKQFCEEYVKVKNNEEVLNKEINIIKVKNCELENEIERYKELLKSIEKKKEKEIENNNFEYDLKIRRLEKQIDFLNSCLSKEKENFNLKIKELISLKLQNDKYKLQIRSKENDTTYEEGKDLHRDPNKGNKNNIDVLNKIYTDMNLKVEDIKKNLNDTKESRHYIEEKIKDYENLLSDYVKKITDMNLKYEKFYKLYVEAQHKNSINKSKKKVLKHRIEELKNENNVLSSEIVSLKKDVNSIDIEKNQYYLLLNKAEKKNLLFYHKLNKKKIANNNRNFVFHPPNMHPLPWGPAEKEQRPIICSNVRRSPTGANLFWKQPFSNFKWDKETKDISIYANKHVSKRISKRISRSNAYRSEEFNIKWERKRKKMLFYSDNDHDKKKKKGSTLSGDPDLNHILPNQQTQSTQFMGHTHLVYHMDLIVSCGNFSSR
ncbi:conserved Plasmodium protein, unknown function [Plasmodium ovale wallikeri]|uniref:Uncharacterized protein n=1 Tax=Plasmodium ovale wallikeri TaxID=864142 RepID=A0A1A8Z0H7_PLAOA|nr:conserved Plasmodium protein, unknown function [Plasmodium ovale wallikeri]SBT37290.1 conserved Plasmodium protein, unknown function [Plasmodium ovale wallikeri]